MFDWEAASDYLVVNKDQTSYATIATEILGNEGWAKKLKGLNSNAELTRGACIRLPHMFDSEAREDYLEKAFSSSSTVFIYPHYDPYDKTVSANVRLMHGISGVSENYEGVLDYILVLGLNHQWEMNWIDAPFKIQGDRRGVFVKKLKNGEYLLLVIPPWPPKEYPKGIVEQQQVLEQVLEKMVESLRPEIDAFTKARCP